MKCHTCKQVKSEEEFSWKHKDIRRNTKCKKCHSEYWKQHYKTNRKKYIEKARQQSKKYIKRNKKYVKEYLKINPCVDCGFADIRALDFDHVKGKKCKEISRLVREPVSINTILKEIEKCEVRCANCHRIRHRKEQQNESKTLNRRTNKV